MRLFCLLIFSVALAVNGLGQGPVASGPPGVVVSEWEWAIHISRLSRRAGSSITADDAAAQRRRERNRQSAGADPAPADIRKGDVAGNRGLNAAPDPFAIGPGALDGRPYGFLYKVLVESRGAKRIEAVSWEYLFLDPLDRSVIARHQFLSKVKIKAGAKRRVEGLSVKQPTRVVRAEAADLPPVERSSSSASSIRTGASGRNETARGRLRLASKFALANRRESARRRWKPSWSRPSWKRLSRGVGRGVRR